MHELLIRPRAALAHDAVAVLALAHRLAVVGHQHDEGFVPKPLSADGVEQFAHPLVHLRDLFHVQGADVLAFAFRDAALDGRPRREHQRVADVFGIVGAGFALPHGFRVPRFVRIKGVHPEQEGAGLVAAVGQPVLGIRHDAGNIAVFGLAELLLAQEAADFVEELRAVVVDDFAFFIENHRGGGVVFRLQRGIQRHIGKAGVVELLTGVEAHEVETAGIAVLGQAHGRGVVDEGRLHVLAPHDVGDGGVVRGKRLPAAVRQREAARHQGAAHGHGGQAFAVGVFKEEALTGEAIDIGGLHNLVAVAAKVVELERVEHDQHDVLDLAVFFHGGSFRREGWRVAVRPCSCIHNTDFRDIFCLPRDTFHLFRFFSRKLRRNREAGPGPFIKYNTICSLAFL